MKFNKDKSAKALNKLYRFVRKKYPKFGKWTAQAVIWGDGDFSIRLNHGNQEITKIFHRWGILSTKYQDLRFIQEELSEEIFHYPRNLKRLQNELKNVNKKLRKKEKLKGKVSKKDAEDIKFIPETTKKGFEDARKLIKK